MKYDISRFSKGTYITVEDKRVPEQFYIIQEGTVRITREILASAWKKNENLGPGDMFGIISTMAGHNQIETALAASDAVLIKVSYAQFDNFIKNNAPMAKKILKEFSRQMRNLNEILTGIALKSNSEINAGHLFFVGEYYTGHKQYDAALYAFRKYMDYCPDSVFTEAVQKRINEISSTGKTEVQYKKIDDLTRVYPKNTMIFSEGEPGEEVFIIKKGMVKISKIADNNEILLAILKDGDIFGEMALLESKRRGACAIAYEDCRIMVVNQANFEHLLSTQHTLITSLTSLLAKRIWIMYKQIANTQINDPLGRMHDILLIQLEKRRVNLNIREDYEFEFGPKELLNMIGLSQGEGHAELQKLFKSKYIKLDNGKIIIKNIFEFNNQTNYYRKLQ
ncbi:MAG: Crp/Fnr family transcriptional regulator [Treponema sp.]|jgi:CRP-like cAMP-binding protein|nr:Crp/Fnr family transcriptional regulator [Treponema sp.]